MTTMATDAAGRHEAASGLCAARLEALATSRSRAEAQLFSFVQAAVLGVADHLLSERGVVSVDELSASGQEALRAMAKRLVVAEFVLVSGLGKHEAHAMVGLALTPPAVSAVAAAAMERGEAPWSLVRRFWEAARRDEIEVVAEVAASLFGTDPEVAAVERLDPGGQGFHGRPWIRAEFDAALTRELVRRRSSADHEARARRVRADRHAWIEASPDGSATVTIEGPLTTWVGAHARIDRAARRLRAGGDTRTLDQLRHDVTASLLHYGTLPLPGTEPVDEQLDVADMDRIAAVLAAQGPVSLQMVVPVTDLTAGWCNRDGSGAGVGTASAATSTAVTSTAVKKTGVANPALTTCGDDPRHRRLAGVAEIPGRVPAFLPPDAALRLALAAGTTLHRIVTDPVDGRCIERTITTYRPDADMRRQLAAADVYSRAPGSRQPARSCDLDHVTPWSGPGGDATAPPPGATSETNLQVLDRETHLFKTAGHWVAAIGDGRDVTWTTLLGQAVTTRPHDYRQYLPRQVAAHLDRDEQELLDTAYERAEQLLASVRAAGGYRRWLDSPDSDALTGAPSGEDLTPSGEALTPSGEDLATPESRSAAASRALYAMLLARGPGALLARPEDDPEDDSHDGWLSIRSVEVAHRSAAEARRRLRDAQLRGEPVPADLTEGATPRRPFTEQYSGPPPF